MSIIVHIKWPLLYFIFPVPEAQIRAQPRDCSLLTIRASQPSLFSPISGTIRAASEALICGHENMVNNIIAALSCALMLREEERGPGGRWGCVCACRGRASDLQKSLNNFCFVFGRELCLSLKHVVLLFDQFKSIKKHLEMWTGKC